MKITIQKREPDKNGHRALRLVYYHGSKTGQNGSRAQKRSPEPVPIRQTSTSGGARAQQDRESEG